MAKAKKIVKAVKKAVAKKIVAKKPVVRKIVAKKAVAKKAPAKKIADFGCDCSCCSMDCGGKR